jgi:hypothetical protein
VEGVENAIVTAVDEPFTLYARPSERVLKTEIDHIVRRDAPSSPPLNFLVLATGNCHGLDCSPKGDKPGFVRVDDDGRTLNLRRIQTSKLMIESFVGAAVPATRQNWADRCSWSLFAAQSQYQLPFVSS